MSAAARGIATAPMTRDLPTLVSALHAMTPLLKNEQHDVDIRVQQIELLQQDRLRTTDPHQASCLDLDLAHARRALVAERADVKRRQTTVDRIRHQLKIAA